MCRMHKKQCETIIKPQSADLTKPFRSAKIASAQRSTHVAAHKFYHGEVKSRFAAPAVRGHLRTA